MTAPLDARTRAPFDAAQAHARDVSTTRGDDSAAGRLLRAAWRFWQRYQRTGDRQWAVRCMSYRRAAETAARGAA